jgi:hypothetical protein
MSLKKKRGAIHASMPLVGLGVYWRPFQWEDHDRGGFLVGAESLPIDVFPYRVT